jgi:hypothetical protein
MLQKITKRLTYANVMSTLGVFLGLGGGYAIATIGGDGRVIRDAARNFGPSFETVATVPGIVKVQAKCFSVEDIDVRMKNISGKALDIQRGVGTNTVYDRIPPNGASDQDFGIYSPQSTELFHVFRPNADRTPMAQITLSGQEGTDCGDTLLAVQALGSE